MVPREQNGPTRREVSFTLRKHLGIGSATMHQAQYPETSCSCPIASTDFKRQKQTGIPWWVCNPKAKKLMSRNVTSASFGKDKALVTGSGQGSWLQPLTRQSVQGGEGSPCRGRRH